MYIFIYLFIFILYLKSHRVLLRKTRCRKIISCARVNDSFTTFKNVEIVYELFIAALSFRMEIKLNDIFCNTLNYIQ